MVETRENGRETSNKNSRPRVLGVVVVVGGTVQTWLVRDDQ